MSENEGFSWSKFFDFSPLAFGKIGAILVKIAVVVIVIIAIKMVFSFIFGDKSALYNNPKIEAQSGSHVEYRVTQEAPRPHWSTDALGGGFKQHNSDDWGYFIGGKIGYSW